MSDDETPDDEGAGEEAGAGAPPDDSRLEAVGQRIDRARGEAEQVLDRGDDRDGGGIEYHHSGATPEEDDQAIAPPG